jgi:biopolymer transport protein TolR
MKIQSKNKKGSAQVTLSEINVTPMVDVMLVLLIVFMVSAPLMQQGLEVNLPKVKAAAIPVQENPVMVSIQTGALIKIDNKTVTLKNFAEHMKKLSKGKQEQVLIQADQTVPYGIVAQVMGLVKSAGIHRVGLVTEELRP